MTTDQDSAMEFKVFFEDSVPVQFKGALATRIEVARYLRPAGESQFREKPFITVFVVTHALAKGITPEMASAFLRQMADMVEDGELAGNEGANQ